MSAPSQMTALRMDSLTPSARWPSLLRLQEKALVEDEELGTGPVGTARQLADDYLPHGGVLRFLTANTLLFVAGWLLSTGYPSYPSALPGDKTPGWVFSNTELSFLLVFVCFLMVCVVDASIIVATENPLKRQLVWLVFCVNIQATFTYGALSSGYLPVYLDGLGRPLYLHRYIMWACSTMSLIFLLGELAHEEKVSWPLVAVCDVAGIFQGFLSRTADNPFMQWTLFSTACLTFLPTLWGMYNLFRAGSEKLISRESRSFYKVLGFVTIFIWSAFPVVHILSLLQVISTDHEAVAYALLDLTAKGAYSLCLLWSNFYSIDQLEKLKGLGSEEVLCKAMATSREIELASRILLTAKSEAEALKQLHRTFLSRMSHELRTPLNSMIGFNELLSEDNALSPLQKGYISTSLYSAKTLLSMIDNVLEYSRLEAASISLGSHDLDLYDVLDDVVNALRKKAIEQRVDIVYRLEKGSSSTLVGDSQRLGQMIKHLADNAIKSYSDKQRSSSDDTPVAEIRARFSPRRRSSRKEAGVSGPVPVQAGTLDIEVEDHGRGIPARRVGLLFTPFGQVEATDKRSGMGLGLAIVKRLVEAMSGSVSCRSVEGEGSTFSVRGLTFPVGTKKPQSIAGSSGLEASVLVVATQPLLQGLAGQLQSMKVPLDTVDASNEEELLDWVEAASKDGSQKEGEKDRATRKERGTETATHDVLIVEAQLLSQVKLASLPYKRIITLMPPAHQCKESDIPDQESERVLVELMRPITRQALYNALTKREVQPTEPLGANTPRQDEVEVKEGSFLVLAVDDNNINRKVVGAILRRLSVPFHTANDGVEAIERICGTKYDLVLMDLCMPRMGGLEATHIIRTMETSTNEAPVDIVAMTAATSEEDEEECMRSGFTLYLPKPVNFAVVKELIETKQIEKKKRQLKQHEDEEEVKESRGLIYRRGSRAQAEV